MINVKDKFKCVGCNACAQSCPLDCIILQADEEGFCYPNVDIEKCINCGNCEDVCPCIDKLNTSANGEMEVWCVKHLSDDIRFESSSGGAFSALAEYTIHQNGVVIGVAMSDDCKSAKHIAVHTTEDIKKLRGSKYLQSDIGKTYILTKDFLEQGKMVLFSGTPCQIKGLKKYLNNEYDKLVCVELICHGVSSQKLWEKYVRYLEEQLHADIDSVNFRSKKYGWKNFGTKYLIKRKRQYFKFNFEDPYFRMFNSDYSLRPSCYKCNAKNGRSGADITIGDFWKIETVYPEYNDNKGISMVLLNSNKGRNLFDKVKSSFFYTNEKLNYELAKNCNPALYKSLPYNSLRNNFYLDMNKLSFEALSEKYTPKTVKIILRALLLKMGLWKYIEKIRGGGLTADYGILITYKKRRKVK